MPFYLRESDSSLELAGLQSVLIVPCRFCPAASLAVRENEPYIELFRRFLRTAAYESFIQTLTRRLQDRGIETAVFDSRLLHQFVACMWTARRREELAKRAAQFDGVMVLGCDAMVETISSSLQSVDCRLIQGLEIEGLMNVVPTVRFPFTLSLELKSVTDVAGPRTH